MKLVFSITICLILAIGCSNNPKNNEKSSNALLADDVEALIVAGLENKENPEWTKSLDWKKFLRKAFDKLIAKEVQSYGIRPVDFSDLENQETMSVKELLNHLDTLAGSYSVDNLTEIFFYEKWDFNSKNLIFSKDVLGWCPIKEYTKNGEQMKRKVTYIYPKNSKKGSLIAKNYFYEVPWYYEYPEAFNGFDRVKFLSIIFNGIKDGSIDAYDPIYLIDNSKRKFTAKELEDFLGEELNPGKINFYMQSLLFEEEWYFDENTLGITKEVKSFAFVQNRYNSKTDAWSKKILFFLFPK